ncbi:hypothetical protein KIF59_06995 [Enterobacter cloacae subsp. cloacae]|nr:hypothetical protein [Enterobacter cloacae subsp. cloacae]
MSGRVELLCLPGCLRSQRIDLFNGGCISDITGDNRRHAVFCPTAITAINDRC